MNILCRLMHREGQAKAGALSRGKSLLTQLFSGKQSCTPQERKGSSLRSMSQSLLCCRKPLNKAAPQRLPEGPTVCLCGFFSLLKSCHYSSGPNYQPVCNTGQMLGRCCFFFARSQLPSYYLNNEDIPCGFWGMALSDKSQQNNFTFQIFMLTKQNKQTW